MDVLQLLKTDHAEVMKLFQRLHGIGGRGRKAVVEKICDELDVHTQVEEALFYPAVREAGSADLQRLVDEAVREHARAKEQIARIREMPGGDEEDTGELVGMVSTLEQDIERHVTEEEGEMFPRVQEVMDARQRADIGRRVRDLKAQLMGRARTRSTSGRAAVGARSRQASPRGRDSARKRRSTSPQPTRGRAQRGKSSPRQRGRSKIAASIAASTSARSRSAGSKVKIRSRTGGKKRARG